MGVEFIGQDIDVLFKAKKAINAVPSKLVKVSELTPDLEASSAIEVTNPTNRVYLLVGGVLLLTSIAIAVNYYRKHKKDKNLLNEKNKDIEKLQAKNKEQYDSFSYHQENFKLAYNKLAKERQQFENQRRAWLNKIDRVESKNFIG